MATYVGKITLSGGKQMPVGSTLFGICESAASDSEKIVALDDFDEILEGITVHVYFENANEADNPMLNVNGTGAYSIACRDENPTPKWFANSVVAFTFYEASWIINEIQNDVTKYDVGLSNVENKSSETIRSEITYENVINALGFIPERFTVPDYAAINPPEMDGIASTGIFYRYAREDHVHPADTSRVPVTRSINGVPLSSDITIESTKENVGNVTLGEPESINGVSSWNAGSATSLDISHGVLTITKGIIPRLQTSTKSVQNINVTPKSVVTNIEVS